MPKNRPGATQKVKTAVHLLKSAFVSRNNLPECCACFRMLESICTASLLQPATDVTLISLSLFQVNRSSFTPSCSPFPLNASPTVYHSYLSKRLRPLVLELRVEEISLADGWDVEAWPESVH